MGPYEPTPKASSTNGSGGFGAPPISEGEENDVVTRSGGDSVEVKLGRLLEAMEASKDDRTLMRNEIRVGLDLLSSSMNNLAGDQRQTAQIVQSTANQVSALVAHRLDTRMEKVERILDRLEDRNEVYEKAGIERRLAKLESSLANRPELITRFDSVEKYVNNLKMILGAGLSMVGRVILTLLGSGLVGAGIIKLFFH